jgi:hypothetical protein
MDALQKKCLPICLLHMHSLAPVAQVVSLRMMEITEAMTSLTLSLHQAGCPIRVVLLQPQECQ